MRGEEVTDPYSVRELDAKFQTIVEKLEELEEQRVIARAETIQTLERIEQQTIKTNGRVSGLERWQSRLQGGIAILTVLVVPIAIYVITKGM